jgi:hypothetical protein
MTVRRFSEVNGTDIDMIEGQDRFGACVDDMTDFDEAAEMAGEGGYRGNILLFYDYETGDIICPIGRHRNVMYSDPVFCDGWYYFLQGDFNRFVVTLFKCIPGEVPERVHEFDAHKMDLGSLWICGNGVNVISDSETCRCYYPQEFEFTIGDEDQVVMIDEGRVYLERWIESEDVDLEEIDVRGATVSIDIPEHNELIVKDFSGKTVSHEMASLSKGPDGTWWIS